MSEKTFGVGILGFGFMGKVHSYGYLNLPLYYNPPPLKARLIGVCTSNEKTAGKAMDTLNFRVGVTDYKELISRDDIDIIHICTPNTYHHDAILMAMKHNKHIYCDKPLVMNAREAKDVSVAMKSYKGISQMALNNRFFPATMRAKRLIEEGFLGKALSFRACYLHSGRSDPNRPLGWKEDKKISGGGVLLDIGSHIIDLIHHLLGDFKEILAENEITFRKSPVAGKPGRFKKVNTESLSLILARMKNGAVGTIEASKVATGVNDELRFEIHGDKGAMRFNLMEPNWLEVYDTRDAGSPEGGMRGFKKIETVQRYPSPAGFPGPKFSVGWLRAHVACLYNFLDCLAKGKKAEPSILHGVRLQFIMEKAYESYRKRQWVKT